MHQCRNILLLHLFAFVEKFEEGFDLNLIELLAVGQIPDVFIDEVVVQTAVFPGKISETVAEKFTFFVGTGFIDNFFK